MEAASCSIISNLYFSIDKIALCPKHLACQTPLTSASNSAASHLSFSRNFYLPGKCRHFRGFTPSCSSASSPDAKLSPEFAVLLEVDGVLVDAYRLGNRQAFNVAFRKLGLDCANWPEPVYSDLLRKSAGDEERMLILYFNRIGWPTSLPTTEKASFIKSVLREKKSALDELLMSKSLPLRSGVEKFIDSAQQEGVPLVAVTAYCKSGEKIGRSIVEMLGKERVSKIRIIGNDEVENSLYGQLVLGKGVTVSSPEEQLAKEARKAASAEKQRIAEEVASMLKLSVDIDTSSSESVQKIVVALRAAAEHVGVPVSNCALIAGSLSGVAAADLIAMPCVVLRSSLTSRAEFPSARAVMDGFGGADLTISRLRQKLKL